MNTGMFYLYAILGMFAVMTVLFILAEREVKKLKRQMNEQSENERFDNMYRQIENETQIMSRRVDNVQQSNENEFDAVYRRINAIEEKIDAHFKKR